MNGVISEIKSAIEDYEELLLQSKQINEDWDSGSPEDAAHSDPSDQFLHGEEVEQKLNGIKSLAFDLAVYIKPLVWCEVQEPNDRVRYHHVIANTPFGDFVITWRDWKDYDPPSIDQTPWGDWYECFTTLDEAKEVAEQEYRTRILSVLTANKG